jgi:hypothetical protein
MVVETKFVCKDNKIAAYWQCMMLRISGDMFSEKEKKM